MIVLHVLFLFTAVIVVSAAFALVMCLVGWLLIRFMTGEW